MPKNKKNKNASNKNVTNFFQQPLHNHEVSAFSNAEKLDGILENSKEIKIKGIIVENPDYPDLVLGMDKTLCIQNNEVSLTIILKQTDSFLKEKNSKMAKGFGIISEEKENAEKKVSTLLTVNEQPLEDESKENLIQSIAKPLEDESKENLIQSIAKPVEESQVTNQSGGVAKVNPKIAAALAKVQNSLMASSEQRVDTLIKLLQLPKEEINALYVASLVKEKAGMHLTEEERLVIMILSEAEKDELQMVQLKESPMDLFLPSVGSVLKVTLFFEKVEENESVQAYRSRGKNQRLLSLYLRLVEKNPKATSDAVLEGLRNFLYTEGVSYFQTANVKFKGLQIKQESPTVNVNFVKTLNEVGWGNLHNGAAGPSDQLFVLALSSDLYQSYRNDGSIRIPFVDKTLQRYAPGKSSGTDSKVDQFVDKLSNILVLSCGVTFRLVMETSRAGYTERFAVPKRVAALGFASRSVFPAYGENYNAN
jgi:hypothetical protein